MKQQGSPQMSAAEIEGMQQYRDLRKHLKSLSKNQLIFQIFQMANVLQEQVSVNRFLNEKLKEFNTQEKEKESKNESNSSNDVGPSINPNSEGGTSTSNSANNG